MAPTVKKCCCGCSLKTGTFTIGVISVVGSVIGLIYSIARAAITEPMSAEEASKHNITEEGRKIQNMVSEAEKYMAIVVAILEILSLVLSILLLLGTKRENPRLMTPWIIFSVINVVAAAIIYFAIVILFCIYVTVGSGIGILIGGTIMLLISAYCIVVVDSHRRELLAQRSPGKI